MTTSTDLPSASPDDDYPEIRESVRRICADFPGAYWRDLGMPETLWVCRVKEFGPLIVSIDAEGNNIFEQNKVEFNKRKEAALEALYPKVKFIK